MHMKHVDFVSADLFAKAEQSERATYVDIERNGELFRCVDIDGYYIAPEFFREKMELGPGGAA